MICARCDRHLKDDEAEPINMAAATGAGTTIYLCKGYCKSAPRQTTPHSIRH
ncbi:hypothetical protein [Streptomyces sp. NPDC006132]|uniref:hypothetical protein n=1 Tax=Streptomyces sp. NPDC006132 TaxID=3156732 RepID=UPI0033F1117C